MAIDPMLYKKYNNRKTELDVGGTLAKSSARKQDRDAMPKGMSGGLKFGMRNSGFGGLFFFMRWLSVFGRKQD
jgi:hypothetical protein